MQVFRSYPWEQPPTESAAKSAHAAEVSSEQSALSWISWVTLPPEQVVLEYMPVPSGLHFPIWSSGTSAHISPEQSASVDCLSDVHSLSDDDDEVVLGVLPEVGAGADGGPEQAQVNLTAPLLFS